MSKPPAPCGTAPGLRSIPGGHRVATRGADARVHPRRHGRLPVRPDAVAVEEDTCLVLSAPVNIPDAVDEHPVRLMTALADSRPLPPGTVLVRGTGPCRLVAVVNDVGHEPMCTEAWVSAAARGVFRECVRLGLRDLALPPLGSVHGGLDPSRALRCCLGALADTPLARPLNVWLLVPDGYEPDQDAGLPWD